MKIEQIGNRDTGLQSSRQIKASMDFVNSSEVVSDIHAGKLALVIFRPNLSKAVFQEMLDHQATEMDIINYFMNQKFLEFSDAVMIHAKLDQEFVSELYGREAGVIKTMQGRRAYLEGSKVEGITNSWDDFLQLMTSGISTLVLLRGEITDATGRIRTTIGSHQDLERRNEGLPYDAYGIRASYASSAYNNLIHGSDSPADILGELQVFSRYLERFMDGEAKL